MPLQHVGIVTSLGKMHKTVTVTVPWKKYLPKFQSDVTRHKKYLVHDEGQLTHLNDTVTITHGRTFSKRKHFRITEINRRGLAQGDFAETDPAWNKVILGNEKEQTRLERVKGISAKTKRDREERAGKSMVETIVESEEGGATVQQTLPDSEPREDKAT